MEEYEILETIKKTNPNSIGFSKVYGDRIFVKSKLPQWKEFPAHILPTAFVDDYEREKNTSKYMRMMCGSSAIHVAVQH